MQQLGGSTQGCLWMLLLVLQPQHCGFPSRFFLSVPVVPGSEGARPSRGAGQHRWHGQGRAGGGSDSPKCCVEGAELQCSPSSPPGKGAGAPGRRQEQDLSLVLGWVRGPGAGGCRCLCRAGGSRRERRRSQGQGSERAALAD